MISYEVVRRAIEFQRPERLPLFFESLGLSDVHTVGWNQIRKEARLLLEHWATPDGDFVL